MSGYYNDLTQDEQIAVMSAMATLKFKKGKGEEVTREDINMAFSQAVGKPLTIEYMRDPSVVQLMGLLGPGRGTTGAHARERSYNSQGDVVGSTAITDRNLAARGLPVPSSKPAPTNATRYSASAAGDPNRFGR